MQLVDSHCHLDFDGLREQLSQVLARAADAGVSHMLCVAVNLEDYPRLKEIVDRHRQLFASVGVHPNTTCAAEPSSAELIKLACDEQVVAVGETGLDYFRSAGDLDWQRARFENHINAAREVNKPLIIHTRAAADDTMDMLEGSGARECGGVMHCFCEDWATAKRALDIGFYISFSGIVTFKNAQELKQIAKKIPLDKMLIETDSPYLAPEPLRGKTCEPSYVRHTAQYIADLRAVDLEKIATATFDNFFRLFSHAMPAA